jgi:hypothetical protein
MSERNDGYAGGLLGVKAAEAIAGTLGHAGKMPSTTYGIPAKYCKTGRKLAKIKGSVCSVCFAYERGNYIFASTKQSQEKRFAGLEDERWVDAMIVLLVAKYKSGKLDPYHRWHDGGDIQSRNHLSKICAVARATPWLEHWLPTKEGTMLRDFVRDGGVIPANLKIRLSGTMVDGPPPKAWRLTSTVYSHAGEPVGHACPARTQGNECGSCRACWDAGVANVSYPVH